MLKKMDELQLFYESVSHVFISMHLRQGQQCLLWRNKFEFIGQTKYRLTHTLCKDAAEEWKIKWRVSFQNVKTTKEISICGYMCDLTNNFKWRLTDMPFLEWSP